jgi:hypothetical protein
MHLPSVYSDERLFQTENYQTVRKTASSYETRDHIMHTPTNHFNTTTTINNSISNSPSTRIPLVVLEKNGSFYRSSNSSTQQHQKQQQPIAAHVNYSHSNLKHNSTVNYVNTSPPSSVAHLDRIMNDIIQHESYDNHPTMSIDTNTNANIHPTESYTYHNVPDAKLPVYWVSEVPKDKINIHLKGILFFFWRCVEFNLLKICLGSQQILIQT